MKIIRNNFHDLLIRLKLGYTCTNNVNCVSAWLTFILLKALTLQLVGHLFLLLPYK